jgi:hypothetical protein
MRTRRIGILMAVVVLLAGVSTGVAVAETIEKVITVEGRHVQLILPAGFDADNSDPIPLVEGVSHLLISC